MSEKSLKDFLPDKKASYFNEFNNESTKHLISEDEIIKCIKTVMDP